MSKLIEYFRNDFKGLTTDRKLTFGIQNELGEKELVEIDERVIIEHNSSSRLFTFYIPETNLGAFFCREVITKFDDYKVKSDEVEAIGSHLNDTLLGIHKTVYSNRVFFYTEVEFGDENLKVLDELAKTNNLYITVRSLKYVKQRVEADSPLAFISHDSRDKELIARPLATGLSSRLCSVWYDEYSLSIGDSLRESIEKGIKEAKKCVVILSSNFLSNPGWSKKEFNSIFTREMIFNEKIVLPIWFKVKKEDIYNYSPSLADTVALIWPDPTEMTEAEYNKSVELIISKVHTAVVL